MKKLFILFTAGVLAFPMVSKAQVSEEIIVVDDEETSSSSSSSGTTSLISKNGHEVLPQPGEIAIGFSALPVFNYVGNLFTGGGNTISGVNYPNQPQAGPLGLTPMGNAIWLKKMVDAHTAYRARVQFNFSNISQKHVVAANELTPNPYSPQFATDYTHTKNASVLLALGLEKRRGSSRVQGIYGGELLVGFYQTVITSDYGNAMDVNFNTPVSYAGAYNGSSRVTKQNMGMLFFAGARAFGGIEYFFAPKVSVSGELGYTLGISTTTAQVNTYQVWDSGAQATKTYKTQASPSHVQGYGIGLDNINANVNFFFWF